MFASKPRVFWTGLSCPKSLKTSVTRLATACMAVISVASLAPQSATGNGVAFENGSYLYGESPVAETVGAVYFVFEVDAGRLFGAMYQPSSSFDCVYGQVSTGHLNLQVVDAYDQTARPFSVAYTASDASLASAGGFMPQPNLTGMHPIQPLSDLDLSLLDTCRR